MRTSLGPLGTLAVVLAFGVSACSGSPTVTPPVVINTPPAIESLVAASTRVEAERPVQVTAVVKDLESAPDRLTYTWSATPQAGTFGGTTSFNGNQATNTWRPPKAAASPAVFTITLTVSEAYTSAGQAKVNTVSSSTTVRYNDSPTETTNLAYDFLVYKFGNFNVSPADAVSNFSDGCPGKAEELGNVETNRAHYQILSASFPAPVAKFDDAFAHGSVEGPCTFEDIPGPGQTNAGHREFVNGICLLTTVYENFRWYLCDSHFLPPYNTTLASLRGRVPGRVVGAE